MKANHLIELNEEELQLIIEALHLLEYKKSQSEGQKGEGVETQKVVALRLKLTGIDS